MSSSLGTCVTFGPFRLYPTARVLERDGQPLQLGSRALDLLITLIEHAGEIVDHRALIASAWRGLVVDAGNLRVQMTNLRKKLGDGEQGARYIANVPGRGYSFVAPLGRDAADEPASRGATVTVSASLSTLRKFSNGVCCIDLGGVRDPDHVMSAVASAIGLAPEAGDPLPALRSFLRVSGLLLVLKNCEHVIEAASWLAESIHAQAGLVQAQRESRAFQAA
jgi:DNA-binding winged helix-turn-helix (wHTH) protein